MKLVEIKDHKNSTNLPTNTKKCYEEQAVARFPLYNPKKHIFKKKTRLTRKQKCTDNAKHAHEFTTKSNQDEKSQNLPILQLKEFSTKISSSDASQSSKMVPQHQFEPQDVNPTVQPQLQGSKNEVGDVWIYIQSIGQHLLRQESLLPMPAFEYTTSFSQNDRMHYLQLILDFSLRYEFKVQTIFLAFNIYHRIAFAPQFQSYTNSLKATSSLFVAAKYQEIAIPKAQIFTRVDRSHQMSSKQILKLQSEILLHFSFNLGFPTVLHFIDILRMHHKFDSFLREKLILICYSSLRSLALWQNEGSLLALACLHFVRPQLEVGRSKSEDFNKELKWRVQELRRLGIREGN